MIKPAENTLIVEIYIIIILYSQTVDLQNKHLECYR